MRPVLIAAGLLAAAAPLCAQENGPPPSDSSRGALPAGVDSLRREPSPPQTFTGMLAARHPALVVRGVSGVLGAGSRVYLRGVAALNYRTTPLVVVDGIRYVSDPGALVLAVGGQTPSRLDDLDPEEIEQVVVLPGPAAAARYGPEAANGALEVRTLRPRRGGVRIGGFVEAGLRESTTPSLRAWSRIGRGMNGERVIYCSLAEQAGGSCSPFADSLRSVLREVETEAGLHRRARVTAEGGAGTGGRWGYLRGTLDAGNTVGVRDEEEWRRQRVHLAGVLRPLPRVDVDLSLMRLWGDLSIPFGDNSAYGYLLPAAAMGPGDPLAIPTMPPVAQDFAHNTAAFRAAWAPRAGITLSIRGGSDGTTRDDAWSVQDGSRLFVNDGRSDWRRRTLAVAGELLRSPLAGLSSTTRLEVERWSDHRFEHLEFSSDEAFERSTRTLRTRVTAFSLEERLEGRLGGVSGLIRRDRVHYGGGDLWSAGLSGYLLPLAEDIRGLSELRLHGALGWISRPLPIEFLSLCDPFGCGDEMVFGARAGEAELGVEALLGGAVRVDLTGYRRSTTEPIWALAERAGRYTMRNAGVEASLRGGFAPRRGTLLTAELIAWTHRSEVAELDGATIAFNHGVQVIQEGLPLGAWYGSRIEQVTDRDGDGLASGGTCPGPTCEVELAEPEYLGAALPTRGAALGIQLGSDRLRVTARVEHQGGNRVLNRTALYQCATLLSCRAALDPATPLADQAAVVAARHGSPAGFLEDGDFTRLRELSVSVAAPGPLVRSTGASAMRITVSGRNLLTLTGYSGFDPELSFTGSADPIASGEWFTQPHPRTWTVRMEVSP